MGLAELGLLVALIDGERDSARLAELAKEQLRAGLPALREALHGRFGDHHALLIRL